MHYDNAYTCEDCQAAPFHFRCLKSHYDLCTARSQQVPGGKKKAEKEEEILQQEADDARVQWVDQMTNLSNIAMPLSRRIASIVVALISVALAVEPFWSPAAVDVPVPLLQ